MAIRILTLTQNDYEKPKSKAAIAIPQRWSVAHAAQLAVFLFSGESEYPDDSSFTISYLKVMQAM